MTVGWLGSGCCFLSERRFGAASGWLHRLAADAEFSRVLWWVRFPVAMHSPQHRHAQGSPWLILLACSVLFVCMCACVCDCVSWGGRGCTHGMCPAKLQTTRMTLELLVDVKYLDPVGSWQTLILSVACTLPNVCHKQFGQTVWLWQFAFSCSVQRCNMLNAHYLCMDIEY